MSRPKRPPPADDRTRPLGVRDLIRDRPVLFAIGAAAATLLAVTAAYLYQRGAPGAGPCTVEMWVSTRDGPERLRFRPQGREPARAEFEEPTLIQRVEVRGCR